MSPQQHINQCADRYLEAILRLENKEGLVRVKDIASELGLSKGSVSGALKTIKERGLIDFLPYRPIRLTAEGRNMAGRIAARNRILYRFLTKIIHMDSKASQTAARRMGPAVDDLVVEHMEHCLNGQFS